jgi:hypothetical protein
MCGYGSSSQVKQRGDVVLLMGLKSNRRMGPEGGTYTSMASAGRQTDRQAGGQAGVNATHNDTH